MHSLERPPNALIHKRSPVVFLGLTHFTEGAVIDNDRQEHQAALSPED